LDRAPPARVDQVNFPIDPPPKELVLSRVEAKGIKGFEGIAI
jgi:hypothetical protein